MKFIEDLRTQREVVNRHIEKDRQQQQQLEKEISRLAEQLQTVNGELNSRLQLRKDIDQSIEEAEDAFNKVTEYECGVQINHVLIINFHRFYTLPKRFCRC